jgi:transcription elongation factor GreA
MSEKIVLTKQKIESLKEELEKLEKVTKKELSQSLEQARLSDVSEDTDDIIAVMSELEKVEHRTNEIKEILSNASELKRSHTSKHKIDIGCEVKLRNNNKTTKFHIVSEIEADPGQNKISDKSPLGKGLLKAKVGDCVEVKVGSRKVEYKVLEIN